ncbi:MAG: transglutaminase domain-containing protein, partial [Gemmatimonadaceae bacterium]|nr:transglutaminase domain-containing protein [Gemmatimonadaceae bacterium]
IGGGRGGRTATARGRAFADSLIALTGGTGAAAASDTQHVRINGPVLLPRMVPLAVALGGAPAVGRTYGIPVFDPFAAAQRTASVRIAAESLFVLHDSATVDRATRRWVGALPDTVRAWQVIDDAAGGHSAWVDAQGRTVLGTESGGVTLVRMPYELAFENWQIERRRRGDLVTNPDDDIVESTIFAADVRVARELASMRLRLRGADLAPFAVASPRQQLNGDTVTVTVDQEARLTARYQLGRLTRGQSVEEREQWQQYLRAEVQVETMDPDIRDLAVRIRAGTRDPAVFAEALTRWVHDSIAKRVNAGTLSARAVLETRAGDVNDHTQLFVALARSGSLPARVATGLIHVRGKFHYHSWPEVYLGDWVAVDPTLGQFPADAAHLRLHVGGFDRQAELLRLISTLQIDVLDTR